MDKSPVLIAQCQGGSLELYENKIRIKRKGVGSFLIHGSKGEKDIFIRDITAIQLKRPGMLTNGYIQFVFSGSKENKDGIFDAASDENSMIFTKKQMKDVEAFKEAVESKLFETKSPPATNNNLNDLEKLAELKSKGIITEDEFNLKKKQLLGI